MTQVTERLLKEMDEANAAFNAMVAALKSFERYVPRRLVTRLMDSGLEGDVPSAVTI